MITYLIVIVTILFTLFINLIYNPENHSFNFILLALIFGVISCILLNGSLALIVSKCLPKKWFSYRVKLFKVIKTERKFYNFIGVKKWKDYTIELGALNGFRKNKLNHMLKNLFRNVTLGLLCTF